MSDKKGTKAAIKSAKSVKDTKPVAKKVSAPKISVVDSYKKGLLEVNKQEDRYDKIFEQKLAAQYKEFRNLKEHHMQTQKFVRIIVVIVVVIIIALLVLSYGTVN